MHRFDVAAGKEVVWMSEHDGWNAAETRS